MITVNTQLHGYRQGHQLLDSTITLSKADQSVIDRLSDISGPLRPGELFEPYLSAYPLPSDLFYVLARTWQDLSVPRAGCVRTLSVIITIDDWQRARTLQAFLDLLVPAAFPLAATSPKQIHELKHLNDSTHLLPQAPTFRASELLEALFLEDSKPVVLFDAPTPELIAIRMLTALWPDLRRRFALSTFALSPRKIDGRNFDLVFAPKNARVRFADWPGRRIDARADTAVRHRWTGEIVRRVFQSPKPYLLDDRESQLVGEDDIGTPAALRIVLLWGELMAKLERSPSAVLGLLDIANAKMQSASTAMRDLQPALAMAAQRAIDKLPEAEAWEFLGAMVRRIFGTPLFSASPSVMHAVGVLADRSPAGAIELLDRAGKDDAIKEMIPAIADGMAAHFSDRAARSLKEAQAATFRELILASEQLAQAALDDLALIERMAQMVATLEQPLFDLFRDEIMPAIVDDRHAVLARPLFSSLDVAGVRAEVARLEGSGFRSKILSSLLVKRGRQLSAMADLRDALLSAAPSPGREEFLHMTLLPVVDDALWLVRQKGLGGEATNMLLQDMIRHADTQQLQKLLKHPTLAPVLIERIESKRDLLYRVVVEGQLPLTLRTPIVLHLLPQSTELQRRELATNLMEDCLSAHFGGDEIAAFTTLSAILEPILDVVRIVRKGLDRSLPASVINRNMLAFNSLPRQLRQRILGAVEELAERLASRSPLDLDEGAAAACAALLWDAQSVNLPGLLRGAGRLLPTLLYSLKEPVSAIVAAAFPLIYRELAKEDDVPDILKFVPFMDWDRCKTARRKLVDTFISSKIWRPSDFALAACRSSDIERILRRAAKSKGGKSYLRRVATDLEMLPQPCRDHVNKELRELEPY